MSSSTSLTQTDPAIASAEANGPEAQQRNSSRDRGIWVRNAIIFFVGLSLVAFVSAMMLPASSKVESGPNLTHKIQRADLRVTITEQGTLESVENVEIKCKVRGENTVIWVVENGNEVEPGDELVRLDTLIIEDAINERSKYALWSRSGAESTRANARRAALAIKQYEEGEFVVQLKTLQKDLAIAESNLRTEQNMLQHAQRMFERGYVSQLEVDEKEFRVEQAKLNVGVKETEIEVLKEFTFKERMEQLKGDLAAAKANQASLEERAKMDGTRRDIAVSELEGCVIKAPKKGLVIYPSAQAWESAPDIEEGATVHRDQVLLLIPDLDNMQVKVGIHETTVDRISTGLKARVTLPDRKLLGEVSSVASVAQPAGWWNGNMVKYDTMIGLPADVEGLRPGMSAEVEVIVAEHNDVLTIPVAAVVQTEKEDLCWVQTADGAQRRVITLGDSNDVFMVVEDGLTEDEHVVLNPRAYIDEAKAEVLATGTETSEPEKEPQPESSSGEKAKQVSPAKSKVDKSTKNQGTP